MALLEFLEKDNNLEKLNRRVTTMKSELSNLNPKLTHRGVDHL